MAAGINWSSTKDNFLPIVKGLNPLNVATSVKEFEPFYIL